MSGLEPSIDEKINRLAANATRVTLFEGYDPINGASAAGRIYHSAVKHSSATIDITLFGNGESKDAKDILVSEYGVPSERFNRPISSPLRADFAPPVVQAPLLTLSGLDVYYRGGEIYLLSRDS